MQIYFPIAELVVNVFVLLGLVGIVGVSSGMLRVAKGSPGADLINEIGAARLVAYFRDDWRGSTPQPVIGEVFARDVDRALERRARW